MKVNLSEIINYGGYKSSDSGLIEKTLRESDKYKDKVRSSLLGTVVEGNLIEIVNDLDTLLNKNESSDNQDLIDRERERQAAIERLAAQRRLDEEEEKRRRLVEEEKKQQLEEEKRKRLAVERQQRNENCVYDLIGDRGRSMKVFDDHVQIIFDAGSVLTGNITTDGSKKIVFYKDVIGIQFKESKVKKGLTGYLQLETASGLMNNNSSNYWNENTFTFEVQLKTNPTNEMMQEVFSYITKQVSKHKQVPTVNSSFTAADEIRKYKELLNIGAITQDEYEVKKKQLLNE